MPTRLKRKPFEFAPSGARDRTTKETDIAKRYPLLERLRDSLWTDKVAFHLMYILVLLACLVRTGSKIPERQCESAPDILVKILTHMAWSPLLWLVCLDSFFIPLQYAVQPPIIPNHQQLLKRDPVLRARYPKEVHQPGQSRYLGSQVMHYTVVVAITAASFVFSWYI